MHLNLYIDGLFYKGSGIGRYYESLVKEFSKKGIHITTAVPLKLKNDFEKDFSDLKTIRPIFVEYDKFSPKGFIKHSSILKSISSKIDLFFFPHVNLPLYIPPNTITSIHDLRPFTQFWDRNLLKQKILNLYFKRAIGKSKHVICISKTTENELIKFYPESKGKIVVIYRFIDDKFTENHQKNKKLIDTPYILFVGNRKKHKNLNTLIKAFNFIKDKIPHKLVIAGSKDVGSKDDDEIDIAIKEFNLKDRIIEFISPDDDTIINLYQNTELFVFPSLIEGFGLPPLEAVSLGCPVVLSYIPILKEIFENCAVYFNPHSFEDMGDKILHLLSNKDFKNEYLSKQKERIKIFDKDKIINEHLELFDRVIKEGNKS